MRRRRYLPLRCFGDVPLRRLWVVHLRLAWDVVERNWLMGRHVLLRQRHDIPIRCLRDITLRRLDNVPPRRHLVFHLRRTSDVGRMLRETLLRRRYDVLLPCGSIQSFAGNMHVSISNPVEGVVTGSSNIFFIDWFCIFPIACISRFDIFPHASNP